MKASDIQPSTMPKFVQVLGGSELVPCARRTLSLITWLPCNYKAQTCAFALSFSAQSNLESEVDRPGSAVR